MRITKVERYPLCIPFQTPYKIATAYYSHQPIVIVKVYTDEEVVGFGEACPAYEFTGETLHTVKNILEERIAPSIVNQDPFDIEKITMKMDEATVGNPSAKASIDMACYDIMGKATRRPVHKLIGGLFRDWLPVTGELGITDLEESLKKCRHDVQQNVSVLKVKVGESFEKDLEKVKAIREALGPDIRIRLDANQGWKRPTKAIKVIKRLEKYNPEFVEQPISSWDFEGLSRIRRSVDTPIALDESVQSPFDAFRAISSEACDIISIKLMKSGGIWNALKINAIAESAGVSCHMGTMLETSIGVSANVHVAAATRNIEFWDLDLPTAEHGLVDDTAIGLERFIKAGSLTMKVPEEPGLGVSLKIGTFEKYKS